MLIANGDNDIMVPTANSIDMARRIRAQNWLSTQMPAWRDFQNHADFVPKALSFLGA